MNIQVEMLTKELDTQNWCQEEDTGRRNIGVFCKGMFLKAKKLEENKRVHVNRKEIQMDKPWGIQCLKLCR